MALDRAGIGARIKYYRMEKQLSQENLAERTELSHVYISYLERGERTPSLESILNIANALNVSADDLLSDSLLISNSRSEPHGIEILYDCSSEELSIILRCIESLKEILRGYQITN